MVGISNVNVMSGNITPLIQRLCSAAMVVVLLLHTSSETSVGKGAAHSCL